MLKLSIQKQNKFYLNFKKVENIVLMIKATISFTNR